MAVQIVQVPSNGNNGSIHPEPMSRRVFIRFAPRRIGVLEDQVDDAVCRIAALETKPSADPALAARVDNLVEEVTRLTEKVKLVDRRSARSRRKMATIADYLAE
jgi:hypothetical protein